MKFGEAIEFLMNQRLNIPSVSRRKYIAAVKRTRRSSSKKTRVPRKAIPLIPALERRIRLLNLLNGTRP